jgi:mono/diheme cytochrome c family protein
MKNTLVIGFLSILAIVAVSCSDVKRTPGKTYMPDMAYSRAVETYSDFSYLKEGGINYNAKPVPGSVDRNGEVIYQMLKDTAGSYNVAASMVNPLPALNEKDMAEAERLYMINCGICHGSKLDGNGPLYKGGDGPYPAKPATLVGDAKYEAMTEGTMFHSITYGKNMMGAYAGQVTPKQRWMIVHYIKAKQGKNKPAEAAQPATAAAVPAADSTATPK